VPTVRSWWQDPDDPEGGGDGGEGQAGAGGRRGGALGVHQLHLGRCPGWTRTGHVRWPGASVLQSRYLHTMGLLGALVLLHI
jgi:hypothetical protein